MCIQCTCTCTYLVNNGLHVRFVLLVAIEKGGPLLRVNAKPRLHGYPDNLCIMFPAKCVAGTELCVCVCV